MRKNKLSESSNVGAGEAIELTLMLSLLGRSANAFWAMFEGRISTRRPKTRTHLRVGCMV